jgi:Ca2+-binding EF-hand superfamily protein
MEQAAQDKHVAKLHKAEVIQKLMPQLREMFLKLDDNGDGSISLDEFGQCPDNVREKICDLFNTDDIVELFEILDVDGGGSISIDEFCDEMTKLSTSVDSLEQIRMMKQLEVIRNEVIKNHSASTNMMEMLYDFGERLAPVAQPSPRASASPSPSNQNALEQGRGTTPLEQRMSALEDRLAKGNGSVEDRLTRMDQSLLEMKQSIGYIVQALEAGKRYDI